MKKKKNFKIHCVNKMKTNDMCENENYHRIKYNAIEKVK